MLVAKLQTIPDLASFLPLFQVDAVVALYLEMSENEQQDEKMMKLRLKEAFTEGLFKVFEKLKKVKRTRESVDVYVTNIKRLAGYMGSEWEQIAKLTFGYRRTDKGVSQMRFSGGGDNGTVFCLEHLQAMRKRWRIRHYRAPYKPGGNRIVEQYHQTVKEITKRGEISPAEATFWYNMVPKVGQREETVPQRSVFT